MTQRDPPPTEEGWYALHDFRTIDWDAWRDAPDRRRQRAIAEGIDYLESHAALDDVSDPGAFGGGQTAVFTVVGHKADLMIVHLRQTVGHLEAAERRFEQTALAEFTEQPTSYLSVTEASGYTERAREYFEGEVADDSGLAQYIQQRLHPEIPDDGHVCFYPMSKRRQPEQNWYDLPFDERAEHMARHGDIGRGYGGKVNQMIASSVGLDDYEWGITLWADDPTDIKDLLNEMRFDPSSSKFAEFGPFYFGKRFPPEDLEALLAGQPVPTDGEGHPHSDTDGHGERDHTHGQADADDHPPASDDDSSDHPSSDSGGRPDPGDADLDADDELEGKLANLGLFPGQDYDEGTFGLVFYSEADASELADEVDGLRSNFDHYDTHVLTTVRANEGRAAIASVWETESAADTAAGFLNDLEGIVEGYRGPLGEQDDDEPEAAGTDDEIRGELVEEDIYAGQPRGEDVFALVLYSEADADTLFEEVDDLRESFDHYDSHVKTAVYDTRGARSAPESTSGEQSDPRAAADSDRSAVVSLWETEKAAEKAAGFLSDLPEVVGRAGEGEGFGTMGMFYTVKPDYREEFTERFDAVGELLADMDGHRETALLVNREDENDMFIASQWDSQDDAMAFFRSEEFSETVSWGQEVLDDRPRHVFLA